MPQRLRPFPAVSAIFVIHQVISFLFLISKEIKSKSIFLHFYQDCLGNETSEPEKSTPIAERSVRKKITNKKHLLRFKYLSVFLTHQ